MERGGDERAVAAGLGEHRQVLLVPDAASHQQSRVRQDGVCYVGGASWHGEWIMRISVTSGETTMADIEMSADAIIAAWRAVQKS